jgi:hypothetical protein
MKEETDAEEKRRGEEKNVPCDGEKKKELGTEVRRERGSWVRWLSTGWYR